MNHYFIHDTPIGELVIETTLDHLIKISFRDRLINYTKKFSKNIKSLILEKTIDQFNEYFLNNRKRFTIPYILNTTPFYRKVLAEVSKIPFGEIRTYKQIAKIVNNQNAYRAVANANASNPLPIIIPCHRIIKSSGEIGGYGGGVKNKSFLLKHENKLGRFY
tara:strand:- start:488 stop:973 length:486 start_codon:yes stop_codon:yes gene_type:complete